MAKITAKRLRELLDYEPKTGIFRWNRPHGKVAAGEIAGSRHPSGYFILCLYSQKYRAHRLAWFYVYGKWPKKNLDHKDRNKLNNAISNLREADQAMNCYNRKPNVNSKSGIKGVYFETRNNKYRSRIVVRGKEIWLGCFWDKYDAKAAYDAALIKYAGEFAGGI